MRRSAAGPGYSAQPASPDLDKVAKFLDHARAGYLFSLCRRLVWMRLSLLGNMLRHSPAARRRALAVLGILLLGLFVRAMLLPSSGSGAHGIYHARSANGHNESRASSRRGPARANASRYAADLRSRFVDPENALRQTAQKLDSELAALRGERVRGIGPPPVKPCGGERHPDFRIAVALPWVSDSARGVGWEQLPAWLPFFVATAAHSAYLVDFLIFHEEPIPASLVPASVHAPNVRFIDLRSGGVADVFGRTLSAALDLPAANATDVTARLRYVLRFRTRAPPFPERAPSIYGRYMFRKWPRLVAEYKPAYGTIFAEWLVNYTHWAYSDFDVVLGHLPRFMERNELVDHHIVTYSHGDTDAVYLRGQWTVHQNVPQVKKKK